MTTATMKTVEDLIAFIHEEGAVSINKVCTEFNIGQTDAEELLSTLDTEDGTLYQFDEDTYTIEDSDRDLEEVLKTHSMGGGIALNQSLPVRSKSAKAQKEDNVSATTAKPKAKTKGKTTKAKGKPKVKKDKTKVETPEAETKPTKAKKKPTKTKKVAKPKEKKLALTVLKGGKAEKTAEKKTEAKAAKKAEADKVKVEKALTKAKLKAEKAEAKAKAKEEKAAAKAKAKAEKKPRVVKPRSSRTIEDAAEAKTLGVKVGTEVKECFDCKVTFAKYGGQFRPRWTEAERKLLEGIKATNGGEINPKHVQPRCIACDRLRSKRKTRLKALTRAVAVEIGSDTIDAESVVQRLNRKTAGIPDGKSSTVLIDDSIEEFTPSLRGVLVSLAEGLIKIRWTSGETPEILGATKKAIAGVKPPKVKAPEPKPEPKAKKAKKPTKVKKVEAEDKPKAKKTVRKPKVKKEKAEAKAEATSEPKPW